MMTRLFPIGVGLGCSKNVTNISLSLNKGSFREMLEQNIVHLIKLTYQILVTISHFNIIGMCHK